MSARAVALLAALALLGARPAAVAQGQCHDKCSQRMVECASHSSERSSLKRCDQQFDRCEDNCGPPAPPKTPAVCYDEQARERPCAMSN